MGVKYDSSHLALSCGISKAESIFPYIDGGSEPRLESDLGSGKDGNLGSENLSGVRLQAALVRCSKGCCAPPLSACGCFFTQLFFKSFLMVVGIDNLGQNDLCVC